MKAAAPLICCLLACIIGATSTATETTAEDWWHSATFYQVYPRSFQDSGDDGIGDLNGLTSRLPYLADLGVTAIWLNPIFASPQVDNGYDCSDYTQIHAEYGTLEDFERLAARCRELGIKLVLDFVPNHTSDQHEWFARSVARDPDYENFYVWHQGRRNVQTGEREPPSNWLSMFGGPAWTWHAERGEWYLHQFAAAQPDLNYREPRVQKAMLDVLELWLQRGVAGFRVDAVKFLYETLPVAGEYPNEPLSGECADAEDTCYLRHVHTQDLPETYEFIYRMRDLVDAYAARTDGVTRIIMTEAYTTLANTILYYGSADGSRLGAHVPFNFGLITDLSNASSALDVRRVVDSWMGRMRTVGAGAVRMIPNWVMGNHDNPRVATRFGANRADVFNILLQTLPGVAVSYYGEELGLTDNFVSWNRTVDPYALRAGPLNYTLVSRDPCRVPMPWTADGPANGFSSSARTWLPVSPHAATDNVQLQQSQPFSHLKTFGQLTRLRREMPALRTGTLDMQANRDVLVMRRRVAASAEDETVFVVLNLSERAQEVDVADLFGLGDGGEFEVLVSSMGSEYVAGDVMSAHHVWASGNAGVVLVYLEANAGQ